MGELAIWDLGFNRVERFMCDTQPAWPCLIQVAETKGVPDDEASWL